MAKPVLTVKVYRSRSLNPKERWRWVASTANGRKVAHAYEMAERLFGDHYEVSFGGGLTPR